MTDPAASNKPTSNPPTGSSETLTNRKNYPRKSVKVQGKPNAPGVAQPSPEQYARLKAEAKAPYRGLRQFFYVAFGASGFIGALVFLAQLLAGRNVGAALPNLALQVGVVALMVWLFRLEQRASRPKNPRRGQH